MRVKFALEVVSHWVVELGSLGRSAVALQLRFFRLWVVFLVFEPRGLEIARLIHFDDAFVLLLWGRIRIILLGQGGKILSFLSGWLGNSCNLHAVVEFKWLQRSVTHWRVIVYFACSRVQSIWILLPGAYRKLVHKITGCHFSLQLLCHCPVWLLLSLTPIILRRLDEVSGQVKRNRRFVIQKVILALKEEIALLWRDLSPIN